MFIFFLHIRAPYRWPQIMSATRAVMRWERFASEASFPRHAKCDRLQTSNPFSLPVYMDSRSLRCFIWQSVALSWQAENLKAFLSHHCAEVAAWLPLGLPWLPCGLFHPFWLSLPFISMDSLIHLFRVTVVVVLGSVWVCARARVWRVCVCVHRKNSNLNLIPQESSISHWQRASS